MKTLSLKDRLKISGLKDNPNAKTIVKLLLKARQTSEIWLSLREFGIDFSLPPEYMALTDQSRVLTLLKKYYK